MTLEDIDSEAAVREAVEPSWEPEATSIERATITHFARWAGARTGQDLTAYRDLWAWSIGDVEGFWTAIWDYFRVEASVPARAPLGSRAMPGAEWFPGAELSYARHIFRDRADDDVALHHASEIRPLDTWTWGRLRAETAGVARSLKAAGVGRGDVVAAYMPNIPETVAAFLACASIGAVWSSAAPEFGTRAVLDRFTQIEPKVLLTVDGYRYGGKDFDRRETVGELLAGLPTVREAYALSYLDDAPIPGTRPWSQLVAPATPEDLEFTELPFDHPLWVLYSSGTTGLPKAIVHSQGGILLEHLKMMTLHVDARPGDRILWFTTTGWTMWNFLVSCLLTPASIVLYDGSPTHPGPEVLWELAEQAGVTCFGTSASYLSACAKADLAPRERFGLTALRAVGSTGSPLTPEGFDWVYDRVGRDVWLFSTSGGTDVCTSFLAGVPTLPVHRGELQAPALGVAVAAWDPQGRPVQETVGELVVTEPMPSMPLRLWGDESGERLQASYFDMYPGVWRHGDWVEMTPSGGAIIHGRSDSTINRGGVRIGTAEIYRALLTIDEVVDALVVDVPREGTPGWVMLFVVLRPGAILDDCLTGTLRDRIRRDCSPRHVPDEVHAVAEVPRTLSGKLLEVPVKRILMGARTDEVVSPGSLANPGALTYFDVLARTVWRTGRASSERGTDV
ncbi:acetoacetate--CoA ligase [Nocardia sp. NPDC005745]|uniref:acetoacetate--CoA ligase n=1 Tax=Nocardia sp. NPDC005745 TaxID=3157061 RepID=UPI0033FA6ECF